jgi:hypothetical protein
MSCIGCKNSCASAGLLSDQAFCAWDAAPSASLASCALACKPAGDLRSLYRTYI